MRSVACSEICRVVTVPASGNRRSRARFRAKAIALKTWTSSEEPPGHGVRNVRKRSDGNRGPPRPSTLREGAREPSYNRSSREWAASQSEGVVVPRAGRAASTDAASHGLPPPGIRFKNAAHALPGAADPDDVSTRSRQGLWWSARGRFLATVASDAGRVPVSVEVTARVLSTGLWRVNRFLRGWASYFCYGNSAQAHALVPGAAHDLVGETAGWRRRHLTNPVPLAIITTLAWSSLPEFGVAGSAAASR